MKWKFINPGCNDLGFPNKKPIAEWGGYWKLCQVRVYGDGTLIYKGNTDSHFIQCNIREISSISLIPAGMYRSKLQINGSGTILGTTRWFSLEHSRELKDWIEEQKKAFMDKSKSAEKSEELTEKIPSKSPSETLIELKNLFDAGIITKEEYEEKRQKYLSLL